MPRTRQVNQQPMTSQRIQPPQLGRPSQFQKQLQQIKPKKPGHAKEIILLFVLLVLISLLITTIVLKDTILGWFS